VARGIRSISPAWLPPPPPLLSLLLLLLLLLLLPGALHACCCLHVDPFKYMLRAPRPIRQVLRLLARCWGAGQRGEAAWQQAAAGQCQLQLLCCLQPQRRPLYCWGNLSRAHRLLQVCQVIWQVRWLRQ
jgi:hypothetical protein